MSTTIETEKSCEACAHWKAGSDEAGECRRHAPQTIAFHVDEDLQIKSCFPSTTADDWCGDFEVKD